jgi:hypothetical protein
MTSRNERQFYRILLPFADVGFFEVNGVRMPVREVSERGVRFDGAPGYAPTLGDHVTGIVSFKSVGEAEVTGRLDRTQGRGFVVVLEPPGIPYALLMSLQLFLRQRYPSRG